MFLGIDIGTSGVKAVICDESGDVAASSHAPLTVQRPHPLLSEQNPDDWWLATETAVMGLSATLRSAVKAIGLSGQMHGASLINNSGQALRPAILWNDGRSAAECTQLEQRVPNLRQITGNCAMPGFTAPKLLWVREHEADIFKQTAKVLLPKDYVRLCMSGDYASDMSDSAGTLWLDTAARDWSDDILAACSLGRDNMPQLFEGSEATGRLRADIAQAWGMKRVSIAAGGGDNAAGAVGSGIYEKGDGFLSLGTSGVIFLADESYRPNPDGGLHTFCHALPNRWHQMSVMLSAASAVDWAASVCGFDSPASLYARAAKRDKPAKQEMFLPYLSGERTPHNNPLAQGVFFGLSHSTTADDMAQAVLEGVAFGLADGIAALTAAGAKIKTLSVIGGGGRSDYWGKILASIFNIPLTYRGGGSVGPALGAARLARLCHSGESIEAVCKAPAITHIIKPNPALRDYYQPRRELFTDLYSALSAYFTENQS